jgi:hypothetical protein
MSYDESNYESRVQFPNKMKVESDELDQIESTTGHINNFLRNNLRQLIEPLYVLKALPDLIKNLSTTIVDQFTQLSRTENDMRVMESQKIVNALENKISSSNTEIRDIERSIQEKAEVVQERYNKEFEAISEVHDEYRMKMDQHSLKIFDEFFEDIVQSNLSEMAFPMNHTLHERNDEIIDQRNQVLHELFNDFMKAVDSFCAKRDDFYASLEEYAIETELSGSLEVPYYLIETYDTELNQTEVIPVVDHTESDNNIDPILKDIIKQIEIHSYKNKELTPIPITQEDIAELDLSYLIGIEYDRLLKDLNLNTDGER